MDDYINIKINTTIEYRILEGMRNYFSKISEDSQDIQNVRTSIYTFGIRDSKNYRYSALLTFYETFCLPSVYNFFYELNNIEFTCKKHFNITCYIQYLFYKFRKT